jgi:hypothetical protein
MAKKPKVITTTTTLDLGDGHRLQKTSEATRGECEEDGDDENRNSLLEEAPKQIPVDFATVTKNKLKSNKPCWGCIHPFGKPKLPGKWLAMDKLWETYSENKDGMSEEQLSVLVSQTHAREVLKPALMDMQRKHWDGSEEDLASFTWGPEDVLTHIRFHMVDVKRTIQTSLRNYTILESSLQDCLYRKHEDDDTKLVHDYQAITALNKVTAQKLQLITALKNNM